MKKYQVIIVIALFSFLAGLVLAVRSVPCYLNLSDSEPWGIYRLTPFDGHVFIGELVIMEVPVPARPVVYGRGWLPEGGLLLKSIGAVLGDQVMIANDAIFINQQYSGPVYHQDSQGKPLPELRGSFRIQPGYFLPLATAIPNSFDGRYFGPVSLRLILGKAKPVLIFKKYEGGISLGQQQKRFPAN
jgi:conjugative transfer signal peptidase TraF